MNVAILDDDINFVKKLNNDFKDYFSSVDKKINMITLDNNFKRLLDLKLDVLDIVFLDIDLKEKYNGINFAKAVKKVYPNVIIVFVSENNDFVFPALAIEFFQFIRKNAYLSDMPLVFTQLKDYYIQNCKEIVIEVNKRKVLLKFNEIIYILSIGHDLFIKTVSNEYTIPISLVKFMKKIDFNYLVQIQRNLMINLFYTGDVTRTCVILSDGKEYKVGRKYQENLLKIYEEYLLK